MQSNHSIQTLGKHNIETVIQKLIQYIEKESFGGFDPYDALNSVILSRLAKPSRWLRIVFTQSLKNSPINLRPMLCIPKGYNPKGMGLFLSSYVKLYQIYRLDCYLEQIKFLADWLMENHCSGYSGYCWGYNFDWQSKAFFVPRNTPTTVNTSFIGHAFLDAFEVLKEERYLEVARSACNFLLRDLNLSSEEDTICFSYTPIDYLKVHNANYLGASLLVRTYSITREEELLDFSERAYKYSTKYQRDDGSWFYAGTDYQSWIDSFHTGFNLEALHRYAKCIDGQKFDSQIQKGLKFYLEHFFLEDGTPKYYHNNTYPIDIHSSAQALVALSKLSSYNNQAALTLHKVLGWTIENMQDKKGFFYFRKGKFLKNKIPYMRWGQAWMLHGLTTVLQRQRSNWL